MSINSQEYIEKAKQKAAATDLASMLAVLDSQSPQTTWQQLQLLQAKAQLCRQAKTIDLALVFYQELLAQMEKQAMANWFGEEAMRIWAEVHQFIQQEVKEELSSTYKQQLLSQLKRNMCLLNSEQAMRWLN